MSRFPEYLPDGCPLIHAAPCDAEVFIICNDLSEEDTCFRTQAERGRARRAITGDDACKKHGLSLFRTLSDCMQHAKLFPEIGTQIARAMLTPDHGAIANTPSKLPSHHTWWPYEGLNRSEPFEVVCSSRGKENDLES